MGDIMKITKSVIISVGNTYMCIQINIYPHTRTQRGRGMEEGKEEEDGGEGDRDLLIYMLGLIHTCT